MSCIPSYLADFSARHAGPRAYGGRSIAVEPAGLQRGNLVEVRVKNNTQTLHCFSRNTIILQILTFSSFLRIGENGSRTQRGLVERADGEEPGFLPLQELEEGRRLRVAPVLVGVVLELQRPEEYLETMKNKRLNLIGFGNVRNVSQFLANSNICANLDKLTVSIF